MQLHELNDFNITFRPTFQCNADCAYCSTYNNTASILSYEDFKTSLLYIPEYWNKLGITKPELVTLQYIGGEVLTVKFSVFKKMVLLARDYFSSLDIKVIDGLQTNLIANQKVIKEAFELFSGRVGTSIEATGNLRTINGSPDTYKAIFSKNDEYISSFTKRTPAILTIDPSKYINVKEEIRIQQRLGRDITLRPVYASGKCHESVDQGFINDIYIETFNKWFMQSNIRIEPFFKMVKKIINKYIFGMPVGNFTGCHENWRCAYNSISIDPDGAVYTCSELADKKHLPTGNSILGTFNLNNISVLSKRKNFILEHCNNCEYLNECQGGCMADSVSERLPIGNKTELCRSSKYIYTSILDIVHSDYTSLLDWVAYLDRDTCETSLVNAESKRQAV